jgi:hypothetical protein
METDPACFQANPVKPKKTRNSTAGKSSVRNNRRCKNTALCGAGQARTTIGSVLFTLRRTILSNSGQCLCKTLKPASLASFRVRNSAVSAFVPPAAPHKAMQQNTMSEPMLPWLASQGRQG